MGASVPMIPAQGSGISSPKMSFLERLKSFLIGFIGDHLIKSMFVGPRKEVFKHYGVPNQERLTVFHSLIYLV
jgi:hypothetical protein